MANVSFDDLIPSQGAPPPAPASGVSFDDLVPTAHPRSFSDWLLGRNLTPEQKAQADAAMPTLKETLGIPEDMTAEKFKANAAGASRNIADAATFGLADKGVAAFQAATGSSPSYDAALAEQRAKTQQWAQDNPDSALEAQILGGVVPGAGAAKLGGAALRAAGIVPNLLGKMAVGGAGGAAFGAASEAGHTDNGNYLDAAKKGLTEGPTIAGVTIPNAAIGAAAPIVGAGMGAAGRFVAPYFQPAAPGMGKAATAALKGVTSPDLEQRLAELGPQGTLADTGPGMLGIAQGARTNAMGTPIQAAIDQPLIDRAASTPSRLQADIHANLGIPQDPEALAATIKEYQAAVTDPMYGKVWQSNPPPVNIRPILKNISDELQTATPGGMEANALNKAHGFLTQKIQGGGTIPQTDPLSLHKAKIELDNLIYYGDPGLNIPPSAKSVQQMALKTVRGKLGDELKAQVPGYADANAKAQEYFVLRKALGMGTEAIGGNPAWPQTFEQSFGSFPPAGKQAAREGMTATIGAGVGKNINDLAALKRLMGGELDWNRANMSTAFGPESTQNMADAVSREQTFAGTNQSVRQGSDTAARQAAARNLDPTASTLGYPTFYGDIKGLAASLLNKGYQTLRGGYHGTMLSQLGDVITAPDSPERRALVRALMAGQGASHRAGKAISGAASNPAMVSAILSGGQRRQ